MMRKKIVRDKNKVKEKLRFMLEYEGGFSKRKHNVRLKSETLGFDDEKSQRLALYEGVSSSIMSGSGKYFLSPFIIELGASSFQIGLLNAVGSLVTALSQLVNTEIVDRFKKRKKIVLTGIILQSLVWIPLFLNALLWKSVYLTIFLFGVYSFITPLVTIPMFSWLGDIVFKNRAEFFGRRSQIMGVVNFTTTILGGFLLKRFVSINTLLGFALLFLISSISRFSGYFFVKKMREPEYRFSREHYFSFLDFIRRMYYNNFGLFVLFLALFMFSIGTSSPYFTPYMLRDLGFNYTLFITIDLSIIMIFIAYFILMKIYLAELWSIHNIEETYDIYRSNKDLGMFSKVGSTRTTTWRDTGVSEGYEYAYYVTAVDSAGNEGDKSNTATVKVPGTEVGGDTDEHGCKSSAGYVWCESLKECIKPWETECPEFGAGPEISQE